jgi:hypothetical protein
MSGEATRWFVVLIENDQPVEVFNWKDWVGRAIEERPENSYIVFAKDELDAFVRAQRGEHLYY